jgi:hypothetical protein
MNRLKLINCAGIDQIPIAESIEVKRVRIAQSNSPSAVLDDLAASGLRQFLTTPSRTVCAGDVISLFLPGMESTICSMFDTFLQSLFILPSEWTKIAIAM